MKMIKLTQGLFANVDDDDYGFLFKFKWHALKTGGLCYAARSKGPRRKQKIIYMHCAILGVVDGLEIDHIDGNGLNNMRSNLRHVVHKDNCKNFHRYGGCVGEDIFNARRIAAMTPALRTGRA